LAPRRGGRVRLPTESGASGVSTSALGHNARTIGA